MSANWVNMKSHKKKKVDIVEAELLPSDAMEDVVSVPGPQDGNCLFHAVSKSGRSGSYLPLQK